MATKKPTRSKSAGRAKPSAKPKPQTRLQKLASQPTTFDGRGDDEQLADHSGTFRVTSAIAQAQTGHEEVEDSNVRFASDSLVMRAQARNTGRPDLEPDSETPDDDAVASDAEKRARLATLAERANAIRDRAKR